MTTRQVEPMLNAAQVEAITTPVPNVLVSAGAGSGKTSVLTKRYFHLLDEVVNGKNIRVDEILTLTFTRKAAQEMRERIARKLEEEGRAYERRELNRAPIGTIHSFCESVLREHALDAGIDPNFRLLDDAESGTLQENALDAIFENLWSGSQREREEIGRLLLDVPQRKLRAALLGIFRNARTRGLAINALTALPPTPLAPEARALGMAVEELLALSGTPKWQEALRKAEVAYAELQQLLSDTGAGFRWETYDAVQQLIKPLTPAGGPQKVAASARNAIKESAASWLGAYLDLAVQPYLTAFLVLLARFDTTYREAKDAQGLLDFEDLLLITRDLLLNEEGGAASRLRRKFQQVMVDEFQDTNPLQFSIVSALQGTGRLFMVGDVKQAIYRFIGSDIRVFLAQEQRILGLDADGQRIPMHVNYRTRAEILEPLNGIFSRLWPLDATDDGFNFEPLSAGSEFIAKDEPSIELALWPYDRETSAAELRDREARWIARRILQLTGNLGATALQVTAKEPLTSRPAVCGDVIILFRASTDIPLYEDALRRAGIPFYVVSGRGFYGAREVQDLMYLLRALENPMDDFSLAVVLRSPLVGVSDDALYWLSRDWSNWHDGDPYPQDARSAPQYGRLWANITLVETLPLLPDDERDALLRFRALMTDLQPELTAGQPLDLIDLILACTNYAHVLLAMDGGEQRYANVQKLREVAATFQGRGIFDLSDFQRYLTQLSEQAPREASAPLDVEGSNVVRLMTIHASKGLEAPIVFLADGGREPNKISDAFLFTADGLACLLPTPEGEWEQPAAYRKAVEVLTRDDRREAERLLYVALTRAREHLICCGFTKFPAEAEKRASYADILAGTLGIDAAVEDDTDLPVLFEDTAYPIRIWSPASLREVELLEPPAQAPTLWEEYCEVILTGGELPVLMPANEVERFSRINDRLLPLPKTRREGPLRVGVHRALCYHACPRQYWFSYILHHDGAARPQSISEEVGEFIPLEEDERERLDGTTFGKLLHAVMQRVDFQTALPEQLAGILEAISSEEPLELSDGDQAHLAECLQRFMAMPIYPALQRATKIHRELRFLAYEGGVFVPGIIDMLAEIDGAWWILDYKTGFPSGNHMRQVAIYALGVERTLGVTPARMALAYLDDDGPRNLRDEPVTSTLLDEARALIRAAGEGIRQERFYPTPGRQCARCVYAGLCPDGMLATQEMAE